MTILGNEQGFATTKLDSLLAWARRYSLFAYPFATACCSQQYFAVASPRFDLARFGAEAARFSPRQADALWVVGTIAQRQAPVLRRIYEQMMAPKWVIAARCAWMTNGQNGRFLGRVRRAPGTAPLGSQSGGKRPSRQQRERPRSPRVQVVPVASAGAEPRSDCNKGHAGGAQRRLHTTRLNDYGWGALRGERPRSPRVKW